MRKYLLLCTALTISSSAYAALDCATPPTCEEWGFTMTTSDCAGKFVLRCPREPNNDNAVFCTKEISCENEGYISAVADGYICTAVTSNGKTCYKDCQQSNCGTGFVAEGDNVAYDSAGKAIALLYNNKYYLPKTFSCGGRTFAVAQQNIADNPQYIMPPSSLRIAISKFTSTTSYWTSTQCGSAQHVIGTGACTSDTTTQSCTMGLLNCMDNCPTGYSLSSCTSSQYQQATTTTASGKTCYKCVTDSCPSGQYTSCSGTYTVSTAGGTTPSGTQCYTCSCSKAGWILSGNTCIYCQSSCNVSAVQAEYPEATAVVFHEGGTGDTTGPCSNIGKTFITRKNMCGSVDVCFICK